MKKFARNIGRTLTPTGFFNINKLEFPFLLALLVILFYIAGLHVDKETQVICSLVIIAVLSILSRFLPKKGLPRIIYLAAGSFLVLRYIHWRLFFTLSYSDFFSFVCAWLLFLAELYGIFMFLLSIFVNLRPVERQPAKIPADPADCPSVDVFVPSYDEDEELLAITLIGALSMRYPKDKLNIYLLDDGGTMAKRKGTKSARGECQDIRRSKYAAIVSTKDNLATSDA